MLTRKSIFLLVILAVSSARAASESDVPTHLADEAVRANPDIERLEEQISALKSEAAAAKIWRDPTVGLEYSNIPLDSGLLGDSSMSGIQLKLQQAIPLPSKNEAREEAALKRVDVVQWALEERKLQLRVEVERAYWALALVRQLRTTTERHVELLAALITAVRAKYEVGHAGQHELLRLQVLRDELVDDLDDYTQQDRTLTAVINSALHRKVTTAIDTPAQVSPAGAPAEHTPLFDAAVKHRPQLKRLKALAVAYRAAAEQERLERFPDVTAWAGYRLRATTDQDPGTDFFSVGLSVPLAVDYTNRFRARSAAEMSKARATDAAYAAALDRIGSDLEANLAAWQRASQKSDTYKTSLMPGATTTLDATLAAYKTDRADFATLYQAQLKVLRLDEELRRAQVETYIQKAHLLAIIGERTEVTRASEERQ